MKIRTGFVSNSSSSSFIVTFTKDPTDINNLREQMGDCFPVMWGDAWQFTTEDVINRVHKDIMNQREFHSRILAGEIEPHELANIDAEYSDLADDLYYTLSADNPELTWDGPEMQEASKKLFERCLTRFQNKLKQNKSWEYHFEYSDNDGSFFSSLEHGEIFRNLEYDRISHH